MTHLLLTVTCLFPASDPAPVAAVQVPGQLAEFRLACRAAVKTGRHVVVFCRQYARSVPGCYSVRYDGWYIDDDYPCVGVGVLVGREFEWERKSVSVWEPPEFIDAWILSKTERAADIFLDRCCRGAILAGAIR